MQATHTLLSVLGARPNLGRLFDEQDGYDANGGVAILGHGLWTRRFGADPEIVGRVIQVQGILHVVVGVLEPGFGFPDPSTGLYVPRVIGPGFGGWTERGIARMMPAVTPADVERDLAALIPQMADAFGDFFPRLESSGLAPAAQTLREQVVGDVETTLWILTGAVGIVLLIACANVANLFLVRGQARRREAAVRSTLGADRITLLVHHLSEAGILSCLGGLLGLALAWAGLELLVAGTAVDLPRLHEVGIDGRPLLFTAVITTAAYCVLSVFSLLGRSSSAEVLKAGDHRTAGAATGHRVRNVLVVGQVALALTLLVASGLMVRSFRNLKGVEPGFRADQTLTFQLTLPTASYPSAAGVASFHEQALERLSGLPGVESVGAVGCLPLRNCFLGAPVYEEGRVYGPGDTPDIVRIDVATPGYFRSVGIPLLEGRVLERADHDPPRGAVVVSQALAEHFWPGQSALGRRIRQAPDGDSPWNTIVGVVGSVCSGGLIKDPVRAIYYPMVRPGGSGRTSRFYYTLKSAVPPLSLVGAVRAEIHSLDPDLPVSDVETMESILAGASATTSVTMLVLGISATIALVLGIVGIYGVVSYLVNLRRREIGVRMALGADAGRTRRMILRQGGLLVSVGTAVGLGGSWALTRAMEASLFEVSTVDPLTYGVAATALVVVALVATWFPARRATRVSPAEALRSE